jgi:anthranilate/para-aminobenzoate synthase component II
MLNHTLEFVHEGLRHFHLMRNVFQHTRTHARTHQNQTLPEQLQVTRNMAARISLPCMMGNQRKKVEKCLD